MTSIALTLMIGLGIAFGVITVAFVALVLMGYFSKWCLTIPLILDAFWIAIFIL